MRYEAQDWCAAYPLQSHFPTGLLNGLATRYAEPHRHYHTGAHVRALLHHLSSHLALAHAPELVAAAILFHDAIYDTRRQDNEALSADLARKSLTALRWPKEQVEKVAALVLATAHHQPSQRDADSLLFLDLDLSILGASVEVYDAYRTAIRQEFGWVEAGAYRAGRSRVLRAFLEREHIFSTPELRRAWEDAARRNLSRELREMSA